MGRPRKLMRETDLAGDALVEHIPMSEVYADSNFNCRGEISFESVATLAKQIKDLRQLVPVIVWKKKGLPRGKKYFLVAGFRRHRALQLNKSETIWAVIRTVMDDRESEVTNFIENLARQDLTVLQEAYRCKELLIEAKSVYALAKELNQSQRWVTSRLRVIDFPSEVQQMLSNGRIAKQYITKLHQIRLAKGDDACIKAAKQIESARDPGRKRGRRCLVPGELRTGPNKPTMADMNEVLTTMLNASIIGLAPRMGAYCMGFISKEEILEDIRQRVPKWSIAAVEEIRDEQLTATDRHRETEARDQNPGPDGR